MGREEAQGLETDPETDKREVGKGRKSIGMNAVLNVIKVTSTVIFPLITFPYISRVLQVYNIGRINYGSSIVNYFSLFAMLGVNIYGVREGARKKRGREFDRFASEVFSLNLLATALSYLILFLLLLFVPKLAECRPVIIVQSLAIVLTTFGIEWVNSVFEDYLYITIRSILVQILCMAAMFLLIRQPEDYLKYAMITVASSGLTCVANWIYCRKYTKLRFVLNRAVWGHLYPMLVFFANHLAITIYVSADTTMLGWMEGSYYSGLYAVSVKVYQCIKSLMTAVYMVTLPELSRTAASGEREKYRSLLTDISCWIALLVFPCMAWLIAYAGDIVLLMSGKSYIPAAPSLQILGVALLFAVGSGVVVNCINTPNGFERTSLFATVIAAGVNIVLNIFLIPVLQQNGAAVTTVIAEAAVFIICLVRIPDLRQYLHVRAFLKQLLSALAGSAMILGLGLGIGRCIASPLAALGAGVVLCPAAYLLFLMLSRNRYLGIVIDRIRGELRAGGKQA